MFAPTAYCGGFLLNSLTPSFSGYRFASPGDGDRYVGLVRDYGRLIRQMLERTEGQAARGIYMPKPQLEQAVLLIEGFQIGRAQSELQSLMRISYAVFCLQKQKIN